MYFGVARGSGDAGRMPDAPRSCAGHTDAGRVSRPCVVRGVRRAARPCDREALASRAWFWRNVRHLSVRDSAQWKQALDLLQAGGSRLDF